MPVSDATTNGLALYVHWPFCVSKCPYCDFNSHVRADHGESGWRDALLAELRFEAALTPGRRLTSLFFGGGTPSLMQPATVAAIIDEAARLWGFADQPEITLEANPTSVEADRFAGFAAAGVNRVSLGLQALDDKALKRLGRPHDLAEGLAALDVAQCHFGRVSFDLIYAREDQSLSAWQAELARALAFGTEHLSLYQLTIEPNTRFQTLHRLGQLRLPDEDLATEMYELTQAMTEASGLPAYEISNHARPGAESRHNLQYWAYGDYVGVGPGAHGRRNATATVRLARPESWLAAVSAHGHGLESEQSLDEDIRAEEALMMGLRLRDGIDAGLFSARTGRTLAAIIDPARADALIAQGLLTNDGARLAATAKGRPLTNALIAALLA